MNTPRCSDVDRNCDAASAQEGLAEISNGALSLLQEVTLTQIAGTTGSERVLLGRVWYRLEQERRRRKADVEALERMYFSQRPSF
jgi:hypothetical protein